MATDKRLDQVSNLTDFDYALIVKGTDVAKVTKQQLAELVGNLLYGATTKEALATVVSGLLPAEVFKNRSTPSTNDANQLSESGMYEVAGKAMTNLPVGNYGFLLHFQSAQGRTIQICADVAGSLYQIRTCNYGTWNSWKTIAQ